MYTIGQFSRICSLSVKTLRFYDEIRLVEPARVDPFTGYRYYAPQQVEGVRLVAALRDVGLPLESIARCLSGGSTLAAELAAHDDRLRVEMAALTSRQGKLRQWMVRLEVTPMEQKYKVALESVEAQPIVSTKGTIAMRDISTLITEAFVRAGMKGVAPCGPLATLYYDEEYNPDAVTMEVAIPVADPASADRILPAIEAAVTLHVGPWDKVGEAYAALFAWVNENGYRASDACREVYLVSMNDGVPPEQYQTKVIVPVARN